MLCTNGTVNTSTRQGWTSQPNSRGTLDIIWACVVTIFLCSWSVLCLNLPALKDTPWRRLRRKFYLATLGILGPEFILQLALGQWSSVCRSVEKFRLAGYMEWSMKHAFFADMGGFILQTPNWKPFPLNAKQIHYVVIKGYIQYRQVAISDQIMAEKSKTEAFGRFITVVQILWFVLNCIGRAAQHLALTTLELTTLGFIVCTIGTFFFWAHKPSDVDLPIVLETESTIAEILIAAGNSASEPYRNTPLDFVSRKEWSWSLYWSHWINILRRPHIVFALKNRPVNRISNDNFPELSSWKLFVLFLFHASYASLNLCGWNFDFPSPVELLLWRVSTCATIGAVGLTWIVDRYAFVVHPILKLHLIRLRRRNKLPLWIIDIPLWKAVERVGNKLRNNSTDHDPLLSVPLKALLPVTCFAVVYCFACAYVLLEDFVNLRSLPPSAFQTVQWSAIIPHFW